jgi:hypothetical protein
VKNDNALDDLLSHCSVGFWNCAVPGCYVTEIDFTLRNNLGIEKTHECITVLKWKETTYSIEWNYNMRASFLCLRTDNFTLFKISTLPVALRPLYEKGVKRPEREADHSAPSSSEVKEWMELYLHSPNTLSWRGAQLNTGLNLPLHLEQRYSLLRW